MVAAAILSVTIFALSAPQVTIRLQTNTKVESPRPEKMISPKDSFLTLSQALEVVASEYILSVESPFIQFLSGNTGENQFLHKYPHDCQDPPFGGSFLWTKNLLWLYLAKAQFKPLFPHESSPHRSSEHGFGHYGLRLGT